jgi:two-component system, NtrC family, response regulator HydG
VPVVTRQEQIGWWRSTAGQAHDTVPEARIVAISPAMRQFVETTRRVAVVDSTVLVTGESGSGKERVARLLHAESGRAARPFVVVNCNAIPETSLEAELFGRPCRECTDPPPNRPSLFDAADGGTLFLDEVGEISSSVQAELLRLMQVHTGEDNRRKLDVRIVAASHRDLARDVANGTFRHDLYHRLKVVELHVPALRERREDLLELAQQLLAESALRLDRHVDGLGPRVAELLLGYDWPGNVRELQNAMERCAVLARGSRAELADLPAEIRGGAKLTELEPNRVRPLREIEKEYILAALATNRGNQTRTAEQLQIGVATLYRKLKSYRASAGTARDRRR